MEGEIRCMTLSPHKVNHILPVLKQKSAKGSERGWQKYFVGFPDGADLEKRRSHERE